MRDFINQLFRSAGEVLPKASKTCWWLLKIILPISLVVRLLQYSGVLTVVAGSLDPVFAFLGLPGESAIVFLTSIFLPLYSSIAVMASLTLTLREATILAIMCLVAHNLLVECAIQKKTGSSFWWMITLRIGMALVIAFVLNHILPVYGEPFTIISQPENYTSITEVITAWLSTSFVLMITIMGDRNRIDDSPTMLERYRLIDALSRPLVPVMRFFGMPGDASFFMGSRKYGGAGLRRGRYGRAGRERQIDSARCQCGEPPPRHLTLPAGRYLSVCGAGHQFLVDLPYPFVFRVYCSMVLATGEQAWQS